MLGLHTGLVQISAGKAEHMGCDRPGLRDALYPCLCSF